MARRAQLAAQADPQRRGIFGHLAVDERAVAVRLAADVGLCMLLCANQAESCAKCGGPIPTGAWKSLVKRSDGVDNTGSFHPACSPLPDDRVSPEHLPVLVSPRRASTDQSAHSKDSQSRHAPQGENTFVLLAVVFLACVVVAIGAFERMPYGYYTFLRIVVSFAAFVLVAAIEPGNWSGLRVLLVGLLILYNPLIPFHLSRDTWFPINIATVLLFAVAAYPASLPRKNTT